MVIKLQEVKPLKNHLLELIQTRVAVASRKTGRWNEFCTGLAVVIKTQPKNWPISSHMIASGVQTATNRAPRSLLTIQGQFSTLCAIGLVRRGSGPGAASYYINFDIPSEDDESS
jgi:hypothetical protein